MSTTSSTGSLPARLRRKVAVGLASVGLLVGASVASLAVGSPAEAACAQDYRYASTAYAYAEAHTEDCYYWSNSYAQHGSVAIWSGWYSEYSWAWADSGFSFSYYAANYFS